MTETNRVTSTRELQAPASTVFALLADPRRHREFDGSGMLVDAVTPGVLTGIGNVFTMRMRNDEMGDYSIDNHVVEFDRDRRIAWAPVLSAASREEDRAEIGHRLHHQWGYELEPVRPDATLVTEFFDCSRSPDDFQKVLKGGSIWTKAIGSSLDKLEQLLQDREARKV
jgi:uncharacterized protein YndB with AHSA1/START domain